MTPGCSSSGSFTTSRRRLHHAPWRPVVPPAAAASPARADLAPTGGALRGPRPCSRTSPGRARPRAPRQARRATQASRPTAAQHALLGVHLPGRDHVRDVPDDVPLRGVGISDAVPLVTELRPAELDPKAVQPSCAGPRRGRPVGWDRPSRHLSCFAPWIDGRAPRLLTRVALRALGWGVQATSRRATTDSPSMTRDNDCRIPCDSLSGRLRGPRLVSPTRARS